VFNSCSALTNLHLTLNSESSSIFVSDTSSPVKSSPLSTPPRTPTTIVPPTALLPGTPPSPNLDQIACSFQNFLQVFKDDNNQLKYLKLAQKMKENCSSSMVVSILDIEKHNQFLADKIRTNYWNKHQTLKNEARRFLTDKLGMTIGTSFLFTITLDKTKVSVLQK
jgi:hypothetical protein